jgi:hypothetical protein
VDEASLGVEHGREEQQGDEQFAHGSLLWLTEQLYMVGMGLRIWGGR